MIINIIILAQLNVRTSIAGLVMVIYYASTISVGMRPEQTVLIQVLQVSLCSLFCSS